MTRHYLLLSAYSKEKARPSAGAPDVANFIDTGSLLSLAKKVDAMKLLENLLNEARTQYLPVLEEKLSRALALQELAGLADLWIRCLFAKHFKASAGAGVTTGKFSPEKAKDLAGAWGSRINERFPDLQFTKKAGLQVHTPKKGDDLDLEEKVCLKGLETENLEVGYNLQPGDQVTVANRLSWTIPLPGKPDFRRDVTVGTCGQVVGFADQAARQVLVAFDLHLPGSSEATRVTQAAWPRNLRKQTEGEHEVPAAPDAAEAAAPAEEESECLPEKFQFLHTKVPEEQRTEVIVEEEWPKLLDTAGAGQCLWHLRGKVAAISAALAESIEPLGPDDLALVHRRNAKGVLKTEVCPCTLR